jgi:hypothetical protein
VKTEISFICPTCPKQDGKKKLYFNLRKKIGYCHRCGEIFTFQRMVQLIRDFNLRDIVLTNTKSSLEDLKSEPIYSTGVKNIFNFPSAMEYLHKRGINDYKIKKYSLFWSNEGELKHRIIFPIIHNDIITGLVGRSIYGEEPKYKYSSGFKTSQALFPETHIKKITFLVEGIIDALVTDSVCIFGSYISDRQIKKLKDKKVKVIFLALDRDTWDNPKMKRASMSLKENGFKVRPLRLPYNSDPADLGKNELRSLAEKQKSEINLRRLEVTNYVSKDWKR